MKILNVRFANINSLKGNFEIDFTNPELAGRGIFAITGETGSGKTTILDAVTLALFGKTPRLSLSAGDNELMTRGAGFSQAEVEFEVLVENRVLLFRSRWEQRRARNAPFGNLQGPRMYLVQVSQKLPGDNWEGEGVGEVPGKIEEITGLNFNRFTRTCLLAQGQFAAFLDAKTGERAQILEQITGTDIYHKLSQASFLRDKEASEKVDRLRDELQGITVLSDSDFRALQTKVNSFQQERDRCDAQKKTIQEHISWVKTLNSLIANRDDLLIRKEKLNSERESQAASFTALAEGRRAEPVRVPLVQRGDLRDQRQKKEDELNQTEGFLPQAEQALRETQSVLEAAREARRGFQESAEHEKNLITEIRARDQQIKTLLSAHAEISRKHDSTRKNLSEAETQVRTVTKTIADLDEQKTFLTETLTRAAGDRNLGFELKALETLAEQHTGAAAKLSLSEKELKTCQNKGATAKKEIAEIDQKVKKAAQDASDKTRNLEDSRKKLAAEFPKENIRSLQDEIERLQGRQSDVKSLVESGKNLLTLTNEEKQIRATIEPRTKEIQKTMEVLAKLEKSHETRDKTIEDLEEKRKLAQDGASFEELRQHLEEGKPCPLCGSFQHPLAGKQAPSPVKEVEVSLKKEKANQKKLAEQIRKTGQALATLQADHSSDEQHLKKLTKKISDARKKWNELIEPFGQNLSPENEMQLDALLGQTGEALKKAKAAFKKFQTASEGCDELEKAFALANLERQKLENARTAAGGRLDQAQALEKQILQQLDGDKARIQAIERKLREAILPFGFVEFDDEVLPRLKTRWEKYQGLQKRLEQVGLEKQKCNQTLAAASTQKENQALQLAELMETLAKTGVELSVIQKVRSDLYGEKDPTKEEKRLQEFLADLQKKEQSAVEQVQACQVKRENLRTKRQTLATGLETISSELAKAEGALNLALQAAGFPDEETLKKALLSPEELKRLADLEKEFETRANLLKGQLEGLLKQIAEHEARRPTSQSLEELAQTDALLAENASQALAAWQEQWKNFSIHQENRARHQVLLGKIQDALKAGERWKKLKALIGSENGKKFQEFAQGLTFSNLVWQANQQLQKLTDRYLLANDGLEMQIIDRYIANARASARNLSGGEKFLASLALALGLAQMVGRKYRMDTLFIDEGFGALDPKTLETAVAVLCSLQQQGKLIGIISHVESLKERLPAQVEVVRLGGGISTISGPGCTKTA